MKDLEKIMRDYRDDFDDLEPGEDHFEHFLSKLEGSPQKNAWEKIPNFLKVAVIITFVILSGMAGYQIRKFQGNPTTGLSYISPEYREVEMFYTSNINDQLNLIDQMGILDDNTQKKVLSEELKDMDERYNQLKKELQLHPDDDRIIEAMIEYYQVKTNVLNGIIDQLYQIKKQVKSNMNVSA